MDKHEYRAKTEQMLEYMGQKSYKQASDIADVIDWRRVKNVSMLCAVSEIYEYNGEYEKSRDILFLAYERSPESRKIIYRLGTLALKMGEVQEAYDCYEEFVKLAPKDPNQYILMYKILKSKKAPIEQQIEVLEAFKETEYVEKWAYELACLYHNAGMASECLEECDDLILWFSEGKYVCKAMELKMKYKPLTPLQQEKYNLCSKKTAEEASLKNDTESTIKEVVKKPVVEEVAIKESAVEEAVTKESAFEEAVEEVTEEISVEEPITEEILTEEPLVKESEDLEDEAEIVEEPVVEETVTNTVGQGQVKRQAPALSIEEMLLEWEEKQKENAQLIQAEFEKVEQEKAQDEAQKSEKAEESILPDDIRKLMEELESEAADIAAQKARQEVAVQTESAETVEEENIDDWLIMDEEASKKAEDKPLIQKVAEQIKSMDILGDFTGKEEHVKEEAADVCEAAEAVAEIEKAEAVDLQIPFEEENLERVVSHNYEPSVVEEAPGIKLGDTQSMAAVAKALKNNVEVELPEDQVKKVPKSRVRARGQNPYDTGFIVQGRYDLDAQSEVGLKAGLTEEQKKLFSYFVPVHGMSEQLVEVLQNDKKCRSRYGTSRIGNLLIIGRKGSGKTVLAVDVVKAIQKARKLKQGKVGIVTSDSLNKKDVPEILSKLHGGAIIIEKASHLSRRSIEDMCDVMEGQTGELLVVLEDERKPLERLLEQYPQFKKKFTSRLELPVFINDELVTFGQTYAKENGYKIDEMGILALYSRIDMMQRNEHIVTVSDVKDILDEAIENSQRASLKKFMKKVFGKNTDDSERIILREEDFK